MDILYKIKKIIFSPQTSQTKTTTQVEDATKKQNDKLVKLHTINMSLKTST